MSEIFAYVFLAFMITLAIAFGIFSMKEVKKMEQRSYERGEELGCPDCAVGEPHVCPYLIADRMPEPQRTSVINHMNKELSEVER